MAKLKRSKPKLVGGQPEKCPTGRSSFFDRSKVPSDATPDEVAAAEHNAYRAMKRNRSERERRTKNNKDKRKK